MNIIFSSQAWEEYLYWQKTDRKTLKRINSLIREICQDPHKGLGKPEALRHALSGYWSRRIDAEHHIVYKLKDNTVFIAQLCYHY